jgi:hypothetical protein
MAAVAMQARAIQNKRIYLKSNHTLLQAAALTMEAKDLTLEGKILLILMFKIAQTMMMN